MLSPLPRRSGWACYFAHSPSRISLPRKGCRVGLRIVLFEVCSAFTRVTACTLTLSPIRDTHSEGFSYFVTSIAAPVASGWSGCRVGLAPTGKRRLCTAHATSRLMHRSKKLGYSITASAQACAGSFAQSHFDERHHSRTRRSTQSRIQTRVSTRHLRKLRDWLVRQARSSEGRHYPFTHLG